ncbi:MAG: anti-sigma factor family protein [Oscillospiraceae bacterium]
MADCEKYQELISLYVDRGISDEEKAELLKHMEHCDDCAELLSIYSEVSRLMVDDAEPPEELLSSVMSGVRRINERNSAPKRRIGRTAIKCAAVAACAAVILIPAARLFSGGFSKSSDENISASENYLFNNEASSDASAQYRESAEKDAEMPMEPFSNGSNLESAMPPANNGIWEGGDGVSQAEDIPNTASSYFTASDISDGYYAVVYADSFPEELEELSERTLFTFSDGTCGAQITMDEFKRLESTENYSIVLENEYSDIALLVYTP